MPKEEEKKYSLEEIVKFWNMWTSQPTCLYRRKMLSIASKVEGSPPTNIPVIGEVVFNDDLPTFIIKFEESLLKEKHLADKFFPDKK